MFESAVRIKRGWSSAVIHFSQKQTLAMENFLVYYFFLPKLH